MKAELIAATEPARGGWAHPRDDPFWSEVSRYGDSTWNGALSTILRVRPLHVRLGLVAAVLVSPVTEDEDWYDAVFGFREVA